MGYHVESNISSLIGKTLTSVLQTNKSGYGDTLQFCTTNGDTALMYHNQDCCESVTIEDICGDLGDLINTPIVDAYSSSNDGASEYGDPQKWTFYHIRTIKGTVTIRWYGISNGYYSVDVDFYWAEKERS